VRKPPDRFLFDECINLPSFEKLCEHVAALPEPAELAHLLRWEWAGALDDEWIPKIAADGWVVVSADKGRKSQLAKGRKLTTVCASFQVTHILVSQAIHRQTSAAKAAIFIDAWPLVARATAAPRGTRFSMRYEGKAKKIVLKIMPHGKSK
jgi:PIN like domain